jgi:hypothetical protein
MGLFEWSLGSRLGVFWLVAKLVMHCRFLMVDSYSSRDRLTGLRARCLSLGNTMNQLLTGTRTWVVTIVASPAQNLANQIGDEIVPK